MLSSALPLTSWVSMNIGEIVHRVSMKYFSEFFSGNLDLSACVLSMWCDIAVSEAAYIVFLAVHTAIFVHVRSLIAPHLAHHICGQFLCRPTCDKIPLREWERLNPPELMDAPVEHPLQ